MRTRETRTNRITGRLQIALMALLYVFLSTFGALTHTDVSPFNEATNGKQTSGSVSVAAWSASDTQDVAAALHCAYCEWQANSVSHTLLPPAVAHPPLPGRALLAKLLTVNTASSFLARFSSRAPPAV